MRVENITCQGHKFDYISGEIAYHDDNNMMLTGEVGVFFKFRVCGKNFMIKVHKDPLLQKLNIDHGKLFIYITSRSVAEKSFFTTSNMMISNINSIQEDKYIEVDKLDTKITFNNAKELILKEEHLSDFKTSLSDKSLYFEISKIYDLSTPIIRDNHHDFE